MSVLVNTWNEEANLGHALASVSEWADEIIVVDMHSDDRTREIAIRFGAKVYLYPRTDFVEPARAFGVQQCTGDWILILDADEIVPESLAIRLNEIAAANAADAVEIHWLNFILGRPFCGGGWGMRQDIHCRFFRPGKLIFDDRIHSKPVLSHGARVLRLASTESLAVLHFNYTTPAQIVAKMNRYTSIEARQRFERGVQPRIPLILWETIAEFLNRYFRLRGFLDGWRGLFMCGLMGFYRFAIGIKLLELQSEGDEADVKTRYAEIAQRTPRFAGNCKGMPAREKDQVYSS